MAKTQTRKQREFASFRREAVATPIVSPPGVDVQLMVDVIWGTETPVRRQAYDWLNDEVVEFDEVLPFTPAECDLSRFTSGRAAVLDAHYDYSTGDVIGVIRSAELRDAKGYAQLAISQAPGLEDTRVKIREGTLANISVGYDVMEWEIEEREGQIPVWRATKWQPMEVSFVPIGADPSAGVIPADDQRSAQRDKVRRFACSFSTRAKPDSLAAKDNIMPKENREPGNEPGADKTNDNKPDDKVIDFGAESKRIADETVKAERKRIADIHEAVRAFGVFDQKETDAFISEGKSVDEVRAAGQKKLAERSTADRQLPYVRAAGGQNDVETRRRLVENALEHRVAPGKVKLEDGARQYRGLSLRELARQVMSEEGIDCRGLVPMELASMAVGMPMLGRSAGMMSTSDFPLILANAVSKRLRDVYAETSTEWKLFSRQSNAPDFKLKYVVQLSEAPRLEKVLEHGEYKYGPLSEAGTNYKLLTYGKIIAITRQAIINDDLGAFDRLPTLYGRAAADNEADIVWALITSNPNMSDGVALFHATHGNLAASGAAISITTLGAARAAMRVQKNIGGKEFMNVSAVYLVVPAALETVAEQAVSAVLAAPNNAAVNVFAGKLRIIVEPRLDASSTTAWYLIAAPSQIDTIEYAYLEGQEGVYTETRIGFNVDGIETKVRDDFGAAVIDYRGFYKNPG